MSDPFSIVHQMRTQAQNDEQNQLLAALVETMSGQAAVMKEQAEAASASQRAAWWISLASVLVAAGSLSVAILALTLG